MFGIDLKILLTSAKLAWTYYHEAVQGCFDQPASLTRGAKNFMAGAKLKQ